MKVFRRRIFSRIVPTVEEYQPLGPQVQDTFAAMGVIEFASADAGARLENDARVAEDLMHPPGWPTSQTREKAKDGKRRVNRGPDPQGVGP